MPNIHRATKAKRQAVYADEALIDRLAAYAAATKQSQNKVLVRALSNFLDNA
jgi:hypothetical protein